MSKITIINETNLSYKVIGEAIDLYLKWYKSETYSPGKTVITEFRELKTFYILKIKYLKENITFYIKEKESQMETTINFVKLELKHLTKNIIGKYIKDSNENEIVKVIDYYDHPVDPFNCVQLAQDYKNYGREIDDYLLLRDFEIQDE
ncbi:MAG: hypothetical protein PHG03_00160 [Bacilli bacterium]|nr:hypothetical protein [Bacilli bacterium]